MQNTQEMVEILIAWILKDTERPIEENFINAVSKLTQITNTEDIKTVIATACTKLGKSYYQQSLYDLTISMHSCAIKHGANQPDNYFQRGFAYIKQKKYLQALEDFKKTKELSEVTPAIDINMAIAYRHLGDYKKTIETLKNIDLTHENLEPREIFVMYINYADAFLKQGDIQDSLKYFLKAEKLFALDSENYSAMAVIYKQYNNYEKYNHYLNLSKNNPINNPSVKNQTFLPIPLEENCQVANRNFDHGINYLLKKDYKEAISYLEKSSAAGGLVERELAIAYKESGNLERAFVSYNEIIKKLKNKDIAVNARHYYERGIVHFELENKKEASKDLKIAQEMKTPEDSINTAELEDYINKTETLSPS